MQISISIDRNDQLDLMEQTGRILKSSGDWLSTGSIADELLNRHGRLTEIIDLRTFLALTWSMFESNGNDEWRLQAMARAFDEPGKAKYNTHAFAGSASLHCLKLWHLLSYCLHHRAYQTSKPWQFCSDRRSRFDRSFVEPMRQQCSRSAAPCRRVFGDPQRAADHPPSGFSHGAATVQEM